MSEEPKVTMFIKHTNYLDPIGGFEDILYDHNEYYWTSVISGEII